MHANWVQNGCMCTQQEIRQSYGKFQAKYTRPEMQRSVLRMCIDMWCAHMRVFVDARTDIHV